MSEIVFSNGCASTGKTILAKEIQDLSEEKFLYVGIDTLFGAMPKTYYITHEKIDKLKTIEEIDDWLDRYAKYDDNYWLNRKYS